MASLPLPQFPRMRGLSRAPRAHRAPHPPRGSRNVISTALLLLLAGAFLPGGVAAQEKRPLDHSDYDRWNRIQQPALSPDGGWVQYRIVPGHGDATLEVRAVEGERVIRIDRGRDARFSRDSRFLVFRIDPTQEARDAAEESNRRGDSAPRDSLGILDLGSGEITRIDRLKAFTLPDESMEWVAIHREAHREAADSTEGGEEVSPEGAAAEPSAGEPGEGNGRSASDREKPTGTDLHYRNLRTGEERVFPDVVAYAMTEDGRRLVWTASSSDGAGDGVFMVEGSAAAGAPRTLLSGGGVYEGLTLNETGTQAAFLTNRDSWEASPSDDTDQASSDEAPEPDPEHALYMAELTGASEARRVAMSGSAGIADGWIVSENGSLSFSEDGTRLFFGTAPRPPAPRPESEENEMLEAVEVDVWSWHDGFLQPHQLVDLNEERRRTYEAVVHLGDGRIVQLETPSLLSVTVPGEGNSALALGEDDLPYRQRVSWDTRFVDLYRVDVATGNRELLVEDIRNGGSISPEGRFVYWWDGNAADWMVMDLDTREAVNATAAIPHPVHNELSDTPGPVGSAGIGGWTPGDAHLIVHDTHDLWLVDPRGREAPRNLTAGYGRENNLRFRITRVGLEGTAVPMDQEILLSAFNLWSKADGYYRTRLDRGSAPERVVMEDASFSTPIRAEDADRFVFTRSTFEDFPDLWVSDPAFTNRRRMSDANPQQSEVVWGTAELVSWTSNDGEILQGILYKPEDFDPTEEWPMMVYFYERSSNGLHGYTVPGTGTSINRSFYVSRGYLLFVPDIPYKTGYPGESAMNAVMPGVLSLVDQGFVDRARIGVQGHSWGGYQIAYMVTRTNLFAAAEAGAPVSNMTSAYGGIRWASGRVRQMQYETGQSRIGGTLWNAQHRFIENSPLFTAYKIETPLLLLHNDEDGAVPWEEGIQLFVALRRLGKPTWLVNYNGQGHGVSGRYPQLDWTIRMQQFFDHYLLDAPPPVWMVDGIPALRKGETLGLELVEDHPVAGGVAGG